jgi:hypothetical protein
VTMSTEYEGDSIKTPHGTFYWSDTLLCYCNSIRVRSATHVEIFISELSCTDMRGAIAAAKALMPTVTQIDTIAISLDAMHRDTQYRVVDGQWRTALFRLPPPKITHVQKSAQK